MAWNDGLTGPALTIASSTADRLRVLAGPGTGKSFSMIRHVARLLEIEGVAPESILAVTFTRNAAKGLVKDLNTMGVNGCTEINSGTLHSYCFRLLQTESVLATLGRVPRPLSTFMELKIYRYEAEPLLYDMIYAKHTTGRKKACHKIREFEAAWAKLQHEDPGWPQNPNDRIVDDFIKRWLSFHRAMFIGEVVPEALRYLRNNPACEELSRFSHVVVDEYQDLNKAEQVLLDLLAENGCLFIVGDEDQSIYRFRHAHPEGIHDFANRHPSVSSLPLIHCRRCPKTVVNLANNLILSNHGQQVSDVLVPEGSNIDGEVRIVQWDSNIDEASGIGRLVRKLIDECGYAAGDILILTPRRKHAYPIRDQIVANGISVHSFYHEELLEPRNVQEAMNKLNLLIDINDLVSQRFWLGIGSNNFNAAHYAKLWELCQAASKSPFQYLSEITETDARKLRISKLYERYMLWAQEATTLQSMTYSQICSHLFNSGNASLVPIWDFISNTLGSINTIQALRDEIIQYVTSPEIEDNPDAVKIMSLHKSKGLTFKVTIIAGAVEGLIPMVPKVGDIDYDERDAILLEQRRLFYVAMTRCKERLFISSFANVSQGVALNLNLLLTGNRPQASRFISELGPGSPRAITGTRLLRETFHTFPIVN